MIPNTFKDYYGDETRWFIGKVLQVHGDPEELGRVKVRIYGVHPDSPQDCSLDELPWASVTLPTTEGGSSGFGGSVGIKEGAQVFGIFLDGKNSQIPLILGSIPKNEALKTKRFNEKSIGNSNVANEVSSDADTEFQKGQSFGRVSMQNQNATRNQPLNPRLMQILQRAATEAGVDVVVFSGGQFRRDSGNPRRVGSIRHDEGLAADVHIFSGGQRLSTAREHPVVSKFIASAVAAGARGIGAGPGYMGGVGIHIDLWGDRAGSKTWGRNARSGNTPAYVTAAYNAGLKYGGTNEPHTVPKQLVSNKIQEKSQATSEFTTEAQKAVNRRATLEGTKSNDVGKTSDTGFTTVSTTTGYDEIKDLPVAAVMTNDIPTQNIEKKMSNASTVSDLTGGSNTNGVLDEVVIQANPKGMDVALREVVGVPGEKVANIVKKASPIEDEIKQAVDVQQTGGIEKDTGSKAVVASKKVSRELGDPFGFLNEFGGIGGGVSNIIPSLLSQGFGKKGPTSITEDVAFVNKGVKLTNENGGKVVPPPIIKSGGTSNLSKVITNPEDEPPNDRITYQVGLDDGKWAGANSRGTNVGGTYDFKSLQTYDHIEAEMKFANDQREITNLIISWSNLKYGYDTYTVDKIHDTIVRKHTEKYGIDTINSRPQQFGFQSHFYVHQSGTVKKVVPARNPIISLKYPKERNKIYEKCLFVTINSSPDNPPTAKLWESLNEIIKAFINVFPGGEIIGLNDLAPLEADDAPGFDVRTYTARKFGKSSTFGDKPIKDIPTASELADREPEDIVVPQKDNKKPNINETVKVATATPVNFDAIAKDYAAQNLKVIDEQRQKADQVRKSIELDGSGKSNNAASTLDKSIDQTLTSNLYHKSEALKNGLRYDKQSRTFKEV
tara:strand:- start:798 stop:3476 length:2679 start_codon:yes stop_codon:yes gene_type:complete